MNPRSATLPQPPPAHPPPDGAHRVAFVLTCGRADPHERITHLGGFTHGHRWLVDADEALAGLESGRWRFHVLLHGQAVAVLVGSDRARQRYLKTETDSANGSLLLTLAERPREASDAHRGRARLQKIAKDAKRRASKQKTDAMGRHFALFAPCCETAFRPISGAR